MQIADCKGLLARIANYEQHRAASFQKTMTNDEQAAKAEYKSKDCEGLLK